MRRSFSSCHHIQTDSRTQPVSNVLNIGANRPDVDHSPPCDTMVQFNLHGTVRKVVILLTINKENVIVSHKFSWS
jgi:hypothetical protein